MIPWSHAHARAGAHSGARSRVSTRAARAPGSREGARRVRREWRAVRDSVRAAGDTAGAPARGPRPHRHEARLRAWRMRHVHGTRGWRADPLLPRTRALVRRPPHRDCGRVSAREHIAPAAGCFRRTRRRAVRLLHAGLPARRKGTPLRSPLADALAGHSLDAGSIAGAADAAFRLAKPMDNTDSTLGWRKEMVRVYVTRALEELRNAAIPR